MPGELHTAEQGEILLISAPHRASRSLIGYKEERRRT